MGAHPTPGLGGSAQHKKPADGGQRLAASLFWGLLGPNYLNLSLSLPRGMTEVTGGDGRSEGTEPLGKLVSFFGFLLIFSLRCSLPMMRWSCAVPQGLRHALDFTLGNTIPHDLRQAVAANAEKKSINPATRADMRSHAASPHELLRMTLRCES